jgi:hypothetical protein
MFYLTKYIYRPCIVNGIFVAVSTRRASTLGKAYYNAKRDGYNVTQAWNVCESMKTHQHIAKLVENGAWSVGWTVAKYMGTY